MALDFGEFDKEQDYGRNLDFGGLASLPEETEYEQFRKEYLQRKERGMGAATWAFLSDLPDAVVQFVEEDVGNALSNDSMIASLFGLKGREDFKGSWKALSKSPELGLRDTWNTIKTIQSNVRDYFNPEVKGEEEIQRAYARQKFELGYYNDAREHYLDQAAGKFKDDINLLADFADPTNLIPSFYGDQFLKQGIRRSIKGTAKGVSVTAKGAEKLAGGVEATLGYPAKVLDKKIPKGGNVYRGLQAGSVMAVGSDPFGGVATTMVTVGVAEALSKVAKATSREVSEIASVLASPSSHARFLFKLSTNENVSKQTRALAARAYKLRGTRMYDVVFDSLVSGVSSAAMQAAIEFAKGKSAEDMSRAAGAGIALGAPVGFLAGSRGSGKTDEARSDTGIENYLANKGQMLNKDTIAALKKVDKKTLVALSTLDEFAGLGNIRLQLLDPDSFAKIIGVDPKDAPSAFYNKKSQNILINEAKIAEGTDAASKIVLHEHGHDIMRQMMGSNPLMRRKILENFYDPNGKEFFFRDSEGSISGSIRVNEQAQQFAKDYADKIRKTDEDYANSVEGTNAFLLAEEIAAEQFSGLMRESPNVFAKYNKSFRHSLMNTARLALSKMGIVEPDSGNLIDSPISESMLKNDGVANVFNNYMQTRNDHYRQRADDIETGRKHEPRAGQSSDNRFTELFGGKGVSTAIGSHYMLKDQTMFDELVQQVAIDSESLDTDLTGIGKGAEGKRLGEGVRNVFRSAGSNAKAAMEFIDFLQLSIDRRQQIKFGYRSANWYGKTGYNPFYERSFTPIGWQISPKKPSIRKGRKVFPNLKVVGYDADIIASNVELLQQAGFITDQTQFFEDFATHAESVLQESGEGRINPLGMGENEIFTAALGMKESGQKLQDPKLNEFFSDPDNKLKNAYKSYDLGGMAGAANMNKGGFAFDYNNAKHNYMPMLSGAGAEGTTIPQTMYMPSISTKDKLDTRGLKNNLLEDVLPNIKQDKFTPEQLMSEVNKSKGAKEFLEDIGIDQKTLSELRAGKTIDKNTLEFLINANSKNLNLKVERSSNGVPRYSDFIERGMETNYEEFVFMLPVSEQYSGGDQSGGHWDNDRVLFWVRKTDRVLPNGELSYHIEEIQSDWHQYAKKAGYDNDPDSGLKYTRKSKLQKILDDGDMKYEQQKTNSLREKFLEYQDVFQEIYKEKLIGDFPLEMQTDQSIQGVDRMVKNALASMLDDYQADGLISPHDMILSYVESTKSYFRDRLQGDLDRSKRSTYEGHHNTLVDLKRSLQERLQAVETAKKTDAALQDARIEIRELNEISTKQSPAPMKKSWQSRALAEAINNAWDAGNRFVTWVTGERSAEMNSLDKHFHFVDITKLDGQLEIHAESKQGQSVRKTIKDVRELEDLIGKKATAMAMKELNSASTGTQIQIQDIEDKHAGRRIFYDKMVVDAAKRFAKVMGTRPPMKSEIVLDHDGDAPQTQQVWLMELPEEKPQLPLYMPSISSAEGDGAQTTRLVREYAKPITDWEVMAWDGERRIRIPAEQALKRKDVAAIKTGGGRNDYTWKDANGNITPLEKTFSKEASQKLNEIVQSDEANTKKLGKALLAVSEVPRTQKTGLSVFESLRDIVNLSSDGKLSVKDYGGYMGSKVYIIFSNPDNVSWENYDKGLGQQIEVTVDPVEKTVSVFSAEAQNTNQNAKTIPSFGLIAYQAVFDFAHNNGLVYKPDSQLTPVNKRRLVSAMLSSVLKNKSYKHLEIHNELKGLNFKGAAPLVKHFNNRNITLNGAISLLAQVELNNFREDFKLYLDPHKFKINLTNGAVINRRTLREYTSEDIINEIKKRDPEFRRGAGLSTVKRTILTSTILDKNKDLKDQLVSPELFDSGALDKIFFMPAEFESPNETSLDSQIDRKGFELLGSKAPKLQDFITAKGEPTFAKKDSKGKYKPQVFYHSGYIGSNHQNIYGEEGAKTAEGTWIPRNENKSYSDSPDVFFLTPEKSFAESFFRGRIDEDGGGYVPAPVEINTNVSNVWDYQNPEHRKLLNIRNDEINRKIARGDFEHIEDLANKIKELGFDAFHVREGGVKNLAVFNSNDMKLVKDVNESRKPYKRQAEVAGSFDPSNPDLRYMPSLPTEPEPVLKTKKAYKLFRVGRDKKLYPLFVNADQPVRIGEWQVAEMGQSNPKTGKVKSKIGDLAYRAGWHASDLPMALHIGAKSSPKLKKPDLRRPDQVWAEVELADDFNWTEIAKERAVYNKDGTLKARTAHIVDQVPYNGHYRYKTNPNMQGDWLISGQMKVNRVLSPTEVKNINDNFGLADLRRNKPQIELKPDDLMYMPAGRPTESVHGYIPPVIKTFDNDAIQYIPDFLVGQNVFPVLGDRLMVGFHKCRSGNVYECRGGHDHPSFEGHKGKVAWACGQSGDKHDSVVAGLLKGIEKSDGYAATVLMKEEALASNRTYARIMMDELEYDSFHVQGGKAIVEKYIQQAAESLNLPIRNLEDLKIMTPTMVFELRKTLLSRVMSNQYKAEIKRNAPKGYNAMSWKDLYKELLSYKNEDGYRHGDIIHILKFDKTDPLIKLDEVGATPDPTYDVSFRGQIVHTMEGHVSAYDVFKEGLDVFAYDETFNASENKPINPERTLQPDRRVGSSAYRVMQLRTSHDLMNKPLTKENTLPSEPIKYKADIKSDEKSLYFRDQKNEKLRKEKQALL